MATAKKPVAKKVNTAVKKLPTINPTAQVNIDKYKTTSASVGDISKKYGIDYSREYAKRQAEAAAQAW